MDASYRPDSRTAWFRIAPMVPLVLGLLAPAAGAQTAQGEVTFSKDIAPILQRSCQQCHNPDGGAPMSLTTYEEVRPYARAIKARTGRPLTAHFADTVSPIPDIEILAIALRLPAAAISERVTRRVDEQFERGLLDEIRTLLARGIPESARPFGGLVYRQALEHLRGARDEASTRALIAQENRRYARRQLIWFRKEPNLSWFDGPGESAATIAAVTRLVDTYVARP